MTRDQAQMADAEADVPLIGRDAEMAEISDFVHRAATHGAALLLTGEAGVGKSALMDNAVQRVATSLGCVVRASGKQFQSGASFSCLDELVTPLRVHLEHVSALYSSALMVALGWTGGRPPSSSVVSNAALALFRRAAEAAPLLIAVDDTQWLDLPSSSVLSFVARRLSGSRVGFLAVSRSDSRGALDISGLPELEVHPLDAKSAAALLRSSFPLLAASVQQRVLVEAGRNPLALLELPTALSLPQRSAREPLPETLPLNHRLDSFFAQRLDALPETSRELLLLLALEGSGDLDLLQATRVVDVLGLMAPAERAGLVFVDSTARRVDFRHPLVGAAVVNRSLPIERRRAHQTLAAVLPVQSERKAWHLAEASVGPDEGVATLLEQAAIRSRARGDAGGAMAGLTKAAELSTDRHAQGRRLLAAAYLGADVTGDLNLASRLLDDATRAEPQVAGTLPAAVAAANLLLNAECQVDTPHQLLTAAIAAYPNRDDAADETLVDALHSLVFICWLGGRPELWAPLEDQLARLKPAAPQALELSARSFGDPVRAAAAGLTRLDRLVAGLPDVRDPIAVTRVGIASVYTDRMSGCRPALQRVIEDGRKGGAVALAINALVSSCVDDWQRGHWGQALAQCEEGLALGRRYGYSHHTFPLGYLQTVINAARGDRDHSLVSAQQMIDWAAPRGAGVAVAFARHIEIVVAQAGEDYESAYQAAVTISPAGVLARYSPHALWVLLDLVEAAVRTNRHTEAEAHVAAMDAADIARISPRLQFVAMACSAFAAHGPGRLEKFATALEVPDAGRWQFDHARVRLAYGEQLGRTRAVAGAREHLRASLGTFEALGAQSWAGRSRRALRATGITLSQDRATWVVSLTPREFEVANLAASGLTNKQIGRMLFLSPRTVGARLYEVFPKLGVTSRAALRDALALRANEDVASGSGHKSSSW
jgi:DNA-binding CsgD family transcriptional regulator